MKLKMIFSSILLVAFLAACGGGDQTAPEENEQITEENDQATDENEQVTEEDIENNEDTDALTTASIVSEADAFVKAVSEEGTWIIATLNDITIEEDVVVAGQFHDKGDEANAIYRKIAPYAQDEDRNITDSYTITVPTLTVQSENLRFQGGTLQGDIIVEANGFNLDATANVDGNIYFASEDVKSTAVIDGEVSGVVEVQ